MKILGIDSSGLVASVALVSDDIMIAEYTINYKKTHSQTLLPMLDEVVQMIGLSLDEIDAIAVAAGPGSFTGLRIGASTAKGLGMALNKPLISVPTVDGIAYNLFGTDKLICPIMDAKRNQVYTGLYEFNEDKLHAIQEQKAISIDEIIEEINQLGRAVIFLGDGVPVYKEQIMNKVKVPHYFAPAHLSKQRAGAVAALGAIYYSEGRIETAADHQPVYLRLSQAERELQEKTKGLMNSSIE
ncbi:tRNA threonylcarbamoyladenosine biosynthesis protein TsaB [Mobilisporobacter senegalensis]|uniref:tRNA threonylcarbamoyladenosine biosynthesis protein TsaB n=1 Tax=Mobilisporobacter senegalensis TaxID=1329262 RepID=A0A3N1X545_9FIRM|nr:tRNA (adenosine(37)-N6)-threonylcarbamoyltransferase complex dimerization subunit type 1 TsaB [Mobilisporobacter senegalensis]ROR21900.1 tRNA threonylcarbamoyladenosine biosynthesis protein TsaB [Mobilisporobacter senegalensis]